MPRVKKIAVTGASGLIGSALVAQLKSDGHQVLKLVRRPPRLSDEVSWDPQRGEINLDLLEGVATKTLSERDVQFSEHCASTVMMVSGGYPAAYEKGKIIYGLNSVTDALVFHAGTTSDGPQVITNGGRVLAVTSFGKTIDQALQRSYAGISKISFENAYFRSDIGKDVI